jgi:ATP-binding cassette subfamily F protein uup
MEGIEWLERVLKQASNAAVVVSHDRYFLENIAASMAEINRIYPGGIFRVDGNYSRFLEKRTEYELAQQKLEESLATKVRREVEWLRRGAKARTTKSKARIDEAGRLIEQLEQVSTRRVTSSARIDFTASDRRTKKLLEARGLCFGAILRGLNLRLSPGMRIGLVGANGSGKTTLLRLLTGELAADGGTIERADGLRIVYFDQNRQLPDPTTSLKRALAPEGDSVIFRDRLVHVNGWAKRFLFRGEQLESPLSSLSGGERARVLIARLMLEPADLLLLDEPTNDLDIPTLEVLEENLVDFPGAMILVTHDRYLLEQVSTAVLGLDGEGGAQMFADYTQYEQWMEERKPEKADKDKPAATGEATGRAKKLGYLEQREFDTMERTILEAEARLEAASTEMNEAAAAGDTGRLNHACQTMQSAQDEVQRLYERWTELASRSG